MDFGSDPLLGAFDPIPARPALKPLPSTLPNPIPHPLDPQDPIMEDYQLSMISIFDREGTSALVKYLGKRADELDRLKRGDKSWATMIADSNESVPASCLLLNSLDPKVLRSIVRGTLTSDRYKDPEIAKALKQMELVTQPGSYLVTLCRNPAPPEQSLHVGKSVSTKELRIVLRRARNYLSGDVRYNDYAEKIDNACTPTKNIDRKNQAIGERRFAQNDWQRQRCLDFVVYMERRYLSRAEQGVVGGEDEPLLRCWQEVGWGKDTKTRCEMHESLRSSNNLLGLVYSILLIEFKGVFEMQMHQLFRVPSASQADVSEILGSMIASSYWFQGGLNPALAGGSDQADLNLVTMDSSWERNQRALYLDSSALDIRVKDEATKLKEYHQDLDLLETRPNTERLLNETRDSYEATLQRYKELSADLANMQSKTRLSVATQSRRIAQARQPSVLSDRSSLQVLDDFDTALGGYVDQHQAKIDEQPVPGTQEEPPRTAQPLASSSGTSRIAETQPER
ncbi:MAG: hypothetical protein M1830_000420 [Pleopsidium flavum]|nr:MAG: hypothetical protein M1830_000420 [Pleopsidium flavum]